jgi:hypothetical protein
LIVRGDDGIVKGANERTMKLIEAEGAIKQRSFDDSAVVHATP